MIRAIIFDFGGVLRQNGVYKAIPLYEKKYKMPKGSLEELYNDKYLVRLELGQISEEEFWRNLASDLGHDTSDFKKLIFKKFIPIQGTWNIVKKCRENYKVGLLTNNLIEWMDIWEKEDNLSENFDAIVTSAKVKKRKPDRKIYLLTVRKLQIKPAECIFIDDLQENVKGAQKVGMKSFVFKSPVQCRAQFKKLGVKI